MGVLKGVSPFHGEYTRGAGPFVGARAGRTITRLQMPALSAIPCLACTVRLFYSGGRISASSSSAELRVLSSEF